MKFTIYLNDSTYRVLKDIASHRGRSVSDTVGLAVLVLDLMGDELKEVTYEIDRM